MPDTMEKKTEADNVSQGRTTPPAAPEDLKPGVAESPAVEPPTYEQSQRRGLEPPPILVAMSAEQRATLEAHLVRKVDLRLLPMIVIMYIMNYIDRYEVPAGTPR